MQEEKVLFRLRRWEDEILVGLTMGRTEVNYHGYQTGRVVNLNYWFCGMKGKTITNSLYNGEVLQNKTERIMETVFIEEVRLKAEDRGDLSNCDT